MHNVQAIDKPISRNGVNNEARNSNVLRGTEETRSSVLAKLNEKIEIGKGTIWLIAIAPAFLGLILQTGISWALSIRDDQSQKEQLKFIQYQLDQQGQSTKEVKESITEMNKGYQEMREFKIKVETAEGFIKGIK